MRITYQFDDALQTDGTPGTPESIRPPVNVVASVMIGDVMIKVEPNQGGDAVEVPAKILKIGEVRGSGISIIAGGRTPNQDYMFMEDSSEYTYHLRQELTGSPGTNGFIEKIMPAGAVAGKEGQLILYKGITTIAQLAAGEWTERIIRPFVITAADIAAKDSGWPETGAAPSVDATAKAIVDEGGDGYNHV